MRINTQRGVAPIVAVILALLVIGGGGYAVKKGIDSKKQKAEKESVETGMPVPGTNTDEMEVKVSTLQVALAEQNKSGQSGQAVLTQVGTSTVKVIVSITGKPSGVAEPAHIHLGSCPTPGAVKYPLTNVEKGASQTEIPITLDGLISELPLAINVHKSAAEASVYVACGDIVKEEPGAGMEKKSDTNATFGTAEFGKAQFGTAGKEVKVNYTSAGFAPKSVTVQKGDTVVFENKTGKAASVASNEHPTHLLYPEFDQYKTDQRGKTEFRFTFEKVGTWAYHDHLNAGMGGTVIVTE